MTPVRAENISLIWNSRNIAAHIPPATEDEVNIDFLCKLSSKEVLEMNELKAKIKASLSPNEFEEFEKYQPECQKENLIYMNKVWELIND
jgi:hypothetical protein